MKHIFVSLLMIAVGALGLLNADSIHELYATLYPAGPAKAQALDYCVNIGLNFDTLTEAQRETCYARSNRAPTPTVRITGPMQR